MAYEIPILDDTFAAAGPIIQYRVVTLGTGGIKMSTGTPVLARGAYVSPTSGAASTASQLGGTVKATTAQVVSIGVALTSAAAAAAGNKRYVSVLLRM